MWLVFFFFLPAMCSVSFYSEISLRFQLNLPSLRMHCNTPRGSLRTDSLEKRGSHSWPVTMEADAVFVLPCLPLCSLELLPIVKRGYASILLHHDRTCLFFKGHEAAGHWSRRFARSREQPWCNPGSLWATPPAVHLQTGGGHWRSRIWKEVCLMLPLCLFTHRSNEYRTFCRCLCETDSLASTFVPNLRCGPKGLHFSLRNFFFLLSSDLMNFVLV